MRKQTLLKRWRIGLLGVIVSVLAIYFIVSQVSVAALGDALIHARYVYLLPTFALLVIALIPRALRWRVLLSGSLPLGRTFSIMNVGYLVNGVLPLRVGELARAYLGTRAVPPVPIFKTISTLIVERLLDLLAVIVLLLLALAGGPIPEQLRAAALIAAPTTIVGFLVLVFLSSQRTVANRLAQRVMSQLERTRFASLTPRLMNWFGHFLDGLKPLTQPRALVLALGWTAASWGISVTAGYILMLAFYDHASWSATCLYIVSAAFAIAVPAVPGNLGSYELSILLALGAMGYGEPRASATAFAVMVHGVNLAVHASTGIIGFIQEGISLEQLSQGVQGLQLRTVNQDVVIGDETR
jgi:uncharacterized protein (TIRG00374 family)